MKEPSNNLDDIVPDRLTSAELKAMALRQQQQIDTQHQLLATKEQRLRFLKQQEVRNAVANAEGERLRRLRERVEAQESKLRRLRALRGQVDLQKTYNVTLSNDLDSIRALFSEKEKELSLAVAKVEALTRQLEDLRRDRRCPINLIAGGSVTTGQPLPPQASRELEKLRRELMYRNQLSLQQDARLHLQREALQQRQAELRSVDQRIFELQTRLQRKKAANIQNTSATIQQSLLQQQQQTLQNNTAKQSYAHARLQQQQPQQHQSQQSPTVAHNAIDCNSAEVIGYKSGSSGDGVAALKQQLLQKQHPSQAQAQAQTQTETQTLYNNHVTSNKKLSNIINRETVNRKMTRGNVAAVEPYIHTPQNSSMPPTSSYLGNMLKHAAATANTNQQNQLIQDHAHIKLNLTTATTTAAVVAAEVHHIHHANAPTKIVVDNGRASPVNNNNSNNNPTNLFNRESDEAKLAKKILTANVNQSTRNLGEHNPVSNVPSSTEIDTSHHIYAEVGPKKPKDLNNRGISSVSCNNNNNIDNNINTNATTVHPLGSKIPKSIPNNFGQSPSPSSTSNLLNSNNSNSNTRKHNTTIYQQQQQNSPTSTTNHNNSTMKEKTDLDKKKSDLAVTSETLSEKNKQQLTVHSMPLGTANKSIATAISNSSTNSNTTQTENASSVSVQDRTSNISKPLVTITGCLAVPPRKPFSTVAPTSVLSSIPKIIPYSPKVNRVAPNVINSSNSVSDRPALPPKPHKMINPETTVLDHNNKKSNASSTSSPLTSNALTVSSTELISGSIQTQNINDNLPIKAKPLTIRKQPLCEQPRLKSTSTVITKPLTSSQQQNIRKIDLSTINITPNYDDKRSAIDPYDLVNDTSGTSNNTVIHQQQKQQQQSPNTLSSPSQSSSTAITDEIDRATFDNRNNNSIEEKASPDSLKRRIRNSSNTSNSNVNNTTGNGSKQKLTRRVSFDPLALLLDASLEGELELVKKTAMQVANPSAANDEGITALHNAICAGHFDIVKFLVTFGCDVNAQDSDGWTPLHCAASCNNLAMIKFLVENGACLFAATLSDHETPAEKCEEDEEGFDGCSEYLYSIQEKLGILHNGEVHAVFSYEAQNIDELTFNVNDRLLILRKGDDAESEWWWAKNSMDEEGYVPRNLLGLYPRVPPQTNDYAD